MNASPVVTLRDVGADLSRPTLTDRFIRAAQAAADAVSRRLWLIEYERAEAIYWPQAGEQHKCK